MCVCVFCARVCGVCVCFFVCMWCECVCLRVCVCVCVCIGQVAIFVMLFEI